MFRTQVTLIVLRFRNAVGVLNDCLENYCTNQPCSGMRYVDKIPSVFKFEISEKALHKWVSKSDFSTSLTATTQNVTPDIARDMITVEAYMASIETAVSETVQRVPVFSLLSDVGGQLGTLGLSLQMLLITLQAFGWAPRS